MRTAIRRGVRPRVFAGLAIIVLAACTASMEPEPDPVGTWNLKSSEVPGQRLGGTMPPAPLSSGAGKTVVLKVEEADGELRAQMTSVADSLLEVDEFRLEDGTMFVEFGAYEYTLSLDGDRVTGTVVSPLGEFEIAGNRQDTGLLYVGEPEEFYTSHPGVVGHRTELAPPEDVEDPAAWVRERVQSAEDLVLITDLGRIAIEFTNTAAFEEELLGYAGQEVRVSGTWRGEKIEIDTIELALPEDDEG
jgi:hypothetical protein